MPALPLVGLVVLSFWVIYFAIQAGMANAYSYGVRGWIERWASNPETELTAKSLDTAGSLVEQMLRFNPDHPFYVLQAAQRFEFQSYYDQVADDSLTEGSLIRFSNLVKAKNLYQLSIERRLMWPDTYVNLARNTYLRGRSSNQVFNYLSLANQAAPFSDAVILGFVEMGLDLWLDSSEQQRMDTAGNILLAMNTEHLKKHAENIISAPARIQRGCALLAFAQVESQVCN